MDTERRLEHSRQASWVTLVGMLLDAGLGALKLLVGAVFNSYALMVDGIHSFTDVASDVLVLVLARMARQAPDEDHPYGHERIETFGTVLMGSLLIGVAGAIGWDSVQRIWDEVPPEVPGWPVLAVAALSVAGKEWIFRYTRAVGRRTGSDLLIANAWHSRSDALSSIIVFVGALGAIAGLPSLDTVAAVLVALIIARIGWSLAWENIKQLVDTAMPPKVSEAILRLALKTEGVRDVHLLRTRKMGQEFLLDLHLQVDPTISVSEGHQIGVEVSRRVRATFSDVRDISFHIDPENDGNDLAPERPALPGRQEVITALEDCWQPLLDFEHVDAVRLHYLRDKVSVELFLHGQQALRQGPRTTEQLRDEIMRAAADLAWLGRVRIWRVDPLV